MRKILGICFSWQSLFAWFSWLLAVAITAPANTAPVRYPYTAPLSQEIPFVNGASLDVLYGYDSTLQQSTAPCVKGPSNAPIPDGSHGRTRSYLHYIADSGAFTQIHQTSASAAYNQGIYSASADVQYMRQYKLNTFSEHAEIAVQVELERVLQPFDKLKLTDVAIRAYRNGGAARFRKLCGDSFVQGRIHGGEFRAILRASSRSSEEQSSTRISLSASDGVLKGNVSDYSYFQSLQSQNRLDSEVFRNGSLERLPNPDFSSLHAYALQFPEEIKKLPTKPTTAWIVVAYDALLEKEGLSTLPPTAEEALLDDGFRYLRALQVARGDMLYVKSHKEQFGPFSAQSMTKRMDEIEREISSVQAWGRQCLSNIINRMTCTPIVKNPIPRTPQRSYPYFDSRNPHTLGGSAVDEMIVNPRDRGREPQFVPQPQAQYPGEKRVFQMIGRWCAARTDGACHQDFGAETVFYCIRPAGSASCPEAVNTGQPILIPPGSDVFVIVHNDNYRDNDQQWHDPLRARVTDQLYPGDLEN